MEFAIIALIIVIGALTYVALRWRDQRDEALARVEERGHRLELAGQQFEKLDKICTEWRTRAEEAEARAEQEKAFQVETEKHLNQEKALRETTAENLDRVCSERDKLRGELDEARTETFNLVAETTPLRAEVRRRKNRMFQFVVTGSDGKVALTSRFYGSMKELKDDLAGDFRGRIVL